MTNTVQIVKIFTNKQTLYDAKIYIYTVVLHWQKHLYRSM